MSECGYIWTTDTGTAMRSVGYMVDDFGRTYHGDGTATYPGEVAGWLGRAWRGAKKLAKRVAKSKVFRAIAKTAIKVAKSTPWGAAAAAALDVAKRALGGAKRQASAARAELAQAANAGPALSAVGRPRASAPAPRLPARSLDASQLRQAADLIRMLPAAARGSAIRRVLGI